MTRLICSTRSAEATSPAMSRPTSLRISTSAVVNATSSSRHGSPASATGGARCRRRGPSGSPCRPGRTRRPGAPSAVRPPGAGACPRAGGVELGDGAPHVDEKPPDRLHRAVAQRGGVEAASVRHANDPPSCGAGAGSEADIATGGTRSAGSSPLTDVGGGATGPSSASPRGSVVDHDGSSPGAVSRTAGETRCGSTPTARPVAVPAHGVGDGRAPSAAVHLPALAVPAGGHEGGQGDGRGGAVGIGAATSRTSRSRTNDSTSAAAHPWCPSPMHPADAGMDGLGPRPGGGGGVEHPGQAVDAAVVACGAARPRRAAWSDRCRARCGRCPGRRRALVGEQEPSRRASAVAAMRGSSAASRSSGAQAASDAMAPAPDAPPGARGDGDGAESARGQRQ